MKGKTMVKKLFLAAALAFSALASADTPPAPSPVELLKAQPLEARMERIPGLTIASPIADVSFYSSIMAIEPPWRKRRFFSEEYGQGVAPEKVGGGSVVRMIQTNDTSEFKLNDYSCVVNGNTATVTLDCEATADIPNVFEYSAFAVPASLIDRGEYEGVLENGSAIKGKLPASESKGIQVIAENVREITFKAQLGTLSFKVLEGPGFNVTDRRGAVFANRKCFWFGYQRTLDHGTPFRSVIQVRFEISDELAVNCPRAASPDAKLGVAQTLADGLRPYDPPLQLLPRPKKMVQPTPGTGGTFAPGNSTLQISIDGVDAPEELERLRRAAVRAFDQMGLPAAASGKGGNVRILIDPAAMENPEGYKLNVSADGITIQSPSPRGAFYALQTLRGLVKNGAFPECSIEDWPDMKLRAAHLLVDDYSKIFHTNLINDVLVPMKYNAIVPECETVKWDSTRDVHQPWGMSKQDYLDMVALCRDNYIDVYPLFQTLGHCGWLFPKRPDGSYANIDLAEDPNYPYAYNVSNPRLYPMIETILDEVMEASGNPEFLHIGHDEVFHPKAEYPHRPENKEKGIQKLLYDDVMWYYGYGKRHNAKIMLWHDLFVTPEESPENGAGGAPGFIANVRKDLPRDLYFVTWRYDGRTNDFPDITALAGEGFNIIGAPWNENNNVENLTKFCKNLNAYGMLQTIWCGYNGNRMVTHNGFFQLTPYVRSGLRGWNADDSANRNLAPDQIFCDLISSWTPQAPGEVKLLDISPVANLKLAKEENPFLNGRTYGLDALKPGIVRAGKAPFLLPGIDGAPAAIALQSRNNPLFPSEVTVNFDDLQIKALDILTAAANISAQPFHPLMTLEVAYTDGGVEVMPIQYKLHVSALDDGFNFYQNTGNVLRTVERGGEFFSWYFRWDNPHPEKNVKSVTFRAADERFSLYILGITAE